VIDYDKLEETALVYMPKLIIAGGSAYPRDWDYARFRKIADSVGAYLMMDMAHISGLVAAQEQANPFEFCDVVTTTTHKSLRGPRAGMIFFRKGAVRPAVEGAEPATYDFEQRVNQAVFPSCQGGPHNNTIAAVATALASAAKPEFKEYSVQVLTDTLRPHLSSRRQVKKNAATLGRCLQEHGYHIMTEGTDNHLILWDLRPQKLTGSKAERLLEVIHITANKNSVIGDTSAVVPGGVRLGTPAMTSRGCTEAHFEQVR